MNEKEVKLTTTLLYISEEGAVEGDFVIDWENETLWASQKTMGELFSVNRQAITKHLQNIFKEKELIENSVCSKMEHTASDGKTYNTKFYKLDTIISVGYRVNSKQATHFKIWATKILKKNIVKRYALDSELLKNGTHFRIDYFNKLVQNLHILHPMKKFKNCRKNAE